MSNGEINNKIENIKRDLEEFKSRCGNCRVMERDIERLKKDVETLNEVIENLKNEININKNDIISLKERIEFFITTQERNHTGTTQVLSKLTEQNDKTLEHQSSQKTYNKFIFLGITTIIGILAYFLKFFIGI